MGDENTFRLPEPKKGRSSRRHSIGISGFELPTFRRKKRKLADEDSLSVQSLDVTKKKRKKSLLRVSSLATLFSSPKCENVMCESGVFKVPISPGGTAPKHNLTPYKAPKPSPAKRRLSRTWSDMMITDGLPPKELSHIDIKRQEAIYELYQSELDLIDDLTVVKKTYWESMKKLQLMSEGELDQIFGPIDALIPVHEDLVNRLQNQRLPDGTTQGVGEQLVEWAPGLQEYAPFCSNQVFGKVLLDEKKNDPAVDDFLQRCQESPFSRKLDLWTLLDGARSRFMKYPLLINAIQKYTSQDDEDYKFLEEAVNLAEKAIAKADEKTGEAKCRYFRAKITYLYDDQLCEELEDSTSLISNGSLKNNKGNKLHIFLFDKVLVLTRPTLQNGNQGFQVFRDPIPLSMMLVEDLENKDVKMGSFRNAFIAPHSQSTTGKNVLRVSFKKNCIGRNRCQAHTLLASSEHDKRQWIQYLEKAISANTDSKKFKRKVSKETLC